MHANIARVQDLLLSGSCRICIETKILQSEDRVLLVSVSFTVKDNISRHADYCKPCMSFPNGDFLPHGAIYKSRDIL